jgi:hypothetical protein
MKKIILSLLLLLSCAVNMHAQAIFNEVKNMQKNFLTIKNDKSKTMDERKIASFKWDAIEYMLYKANDDSTFTEKQLGQQTMAMTEFIGLYFQRLSEAGNSKQKKEVAVTRFKNASLNNSFFNDMDRDLVQAYVDNPKFATPFSLDTDWIKALEEIRSKSWD